MDVVKIGGSVLTDPARPFTIRRSDVARLASEFLGAPGPLVVTLGAGSFARPYARHFAPDRTFAPDQRAIAARLRTSLRELYGVVEDAFLDAGHAVTPLDAPTLIGERDGSLRLWSAEPLLAALSAGRIPLIGATLVPTETGGWRPCSGDALVELLSAALPVRRALWVTDVDGVLDRPGGTVVSVIDRFEDVVTADGDDPTGGMGEKLATALRMAAAGVRSVVVNGLVAGRVAAVLEDETTVSTLIGGR